MMDLPTFSRMDHPRIRGEHGGAITIRRKEPGSSPHTRGAPTDIADMVDDAGIIPAYAGSTNIVSPFGAGIGDHPRIRGEHYSEAVFVPSTLGSSPHTRGARGLIYVRDLVDRIIPAYAGSTG